MPMTHNPSRFTTMTQFDGGSRDTKANLVYDPKTGKWVPATATNTDEDKNTPPVTPPKTETDSDNTSSNTDSKTEAEKKYIEAEFNVLTGEMTITPTTKSICIKVNDTVKIEGLGKYLSGLYFVSAISRSLNKDSGYSHTLTLIKNGFGSSVKSEPKPKEEPRKEEVPKQPSDIKVGDSVKIVGDDAVYSNAHDGVKVPAWVKKKTLTVRQISKDNTRVLLMPILSWTYIKYVQKV